MSNSEAVLAERASATLDDAHVGDITGALGTIRHGDHGPRNGWRARLMTLFAVLGPGLIVMVGDNDAGAFSTYAQAGQNYGTTLLWTLALLIPVLYVNQEMVLRLGAVTGVGHARLIFERFGKFWGAFSVIDLFVLNALTIVTEFIGIALALGYLGVSKEWGVVAAAALVMGAASTGSFRRFEQLALVLVLGSFLIVPVVLFSHPPIGDIAHDTVVPNLPAGAPLGDVMLLIIAIVGTTVAPWQLFFQQSYVVDKRITPRFVSYERMDLALGIVIVIVGAMAIMAATAAAFAGHPEFGQFADTGAVAAGLDKYAGKLPGIFFAVALIDACIIGAAAVSLATAYAIGDVFTLKHSLHRKPREAAGFYSVYFGLVVGAAALVLIPGTPLGLLTNAVQTLAGVLLPGATVFLLLLCNDRAVLGPWVNGPKQNVFTGTVISLLVILSVILTSSVLYSNISGDTILIILGGGSVVAVLAMTLVAVASRGREQVIDRRGQVSWRMPPLNQLTRPTMTVGRRIWLGILRAYLICAGGLVLIRIAQLVLPNG